MCFFGWSVAGWSPEHLDSSSCSRPRAAPPAPNEPLPGRRPESCASLLQPVGAGTRALAALRAGHGIHLLGPLGVGFDLEVERPLLVAGGVGIAPMPYLSEALGEPPALLGFRAKVMPR